MDLLLLLAQLSSLIGQSQFQNMQHQIVPHQLQYRSPIELNTQPQPCSYQAHYCSHL